MPRWPAPRVRRPGALFWDVALAVVIAALSLLTIETGRPPEPRAAHVDTGLQISPAPATLDPGDPVVITLERGGKPVQSPGVEPLLTIQNSTTGEWTTYVAKPTGEPGVFRIPAVFPGEGVYSYSVLYGPFEQNVSIGGPPASRVSLPEQAPTSDSSPVWPVALALLATLPIALRRRYPVPVLAVTLAAALALDVLYQNFFFPGALVALYTVAVQVGRPRSIRVGLATALALPTMLLDESGLQSNLGNWEDAAGVAAAYAVFAAAWLLGDNLRTRRAYLRELEERAVRLEREREENARRAAAEEQARIARELHDLIAHNVAVMTVQAAAAGDVFETQPARARDALGSIEATGREALTELRRLLGAVLGREGSVSLAPQPGLARLDTLVEQVRATGLTVELTVEGSPRELPRGVDLSAYRIVQEALTNTLKHAQASKACVVLRYGQGAVEVDVADDGRGAAANGAERGHGIIGMRERAALVGGELVAGPRHGGGFAVHARIPLEEAGT